MPNPIVRRGVTGTHTTEGRPRGYSSLTPFVVIADSRKALEFYQAVFQAKVLGVTEMPVGDRNEVVHAEIDFGCGRLQFGVPNAAYGLVAAPSEGACYSLGIYVPDVDATVDRALAAGATLREPITDFVSGDRYASLLDPFGLRWSVMTRIEDLTDAESQARVEAWAKSLTTNP